MELNEITELTSVFNLLIDFSEACRTEIRRRVNHSRKVGRLLIESANISDIFNHDKCVILELLQEEFHPFIGNFWQQARVQDPWPTIHDWRDLREKH